MNGSTLAIKTQPVRKHPASWVPTLYFAEGLPFFAVNLMAILFFKSMGLNLAKNAAVVSLLAIPWTLKPIWSPLLEMFKTKKFFVVTMEVAGGTSLMLLALSLNLPGYFGYAVTFLALAGFCSATHDIAADGTYIAALNGKEQAAFAGWQSGFYSAARFFSQGVLIWLAGYLTIRYTTAHGWMVSFGLGGALLALLGLYHAYMLPRCGEERASGSLAEMAATFADVVASFFKKKSIFVLLLFILLYRLGEGQSAKICPLFLSLSREMGGLGLDNEKMGILLGVGGMFTILGSVLAGYFASWLTLRRALPWLIAVLCAPMFIYWYLSVAQPVGMLVPGIAVAAEMFGYGFGFVGLILLMMQEIAPGKYQTAHYAFATSLMQFAFILPGMASGWIESRIGFKHFFPWVILVTLPALLLSRFIPIRGGAQPAQQMAVADNSSD